MTNPEKRFGYFLVEFRFAAGCKSRAAAVEKINNLSDEGEEIVSERQLVRWENGESFPKVGAALALGRAYGAETKKDRLWRWNAKRGHVKKHYRHYTTKGVI